MFDRLPGLLRVRSYFGFWRKTGCSWSRTLGVRQYSSRLGTSDDPRFVFVSVPLYLQKHAIIMPNKC